MLKRELQGALNTARKENRVLTKRLADTIVAKERYKRRFLKYRNSTFHVFLYRLSEEWDKTRVSFQVFKGKITWLKQFLSSKIQS